MTPYQNLDDSPGVSGFELGDQSIRVRMDNRKEFLFDYESCGESHVEIMKKLAIAGKGLSQYIDKHVKQKYAAEFT